METFSIEHEQQTSDLFDDLKDRAEVFRLAATERHKRLKPIAKESWERAIVSLTDDERSIYIKAQEKKIIRFYIKPYINAGTHLSVGENVEVLGVGFYVDIKDQSSPGLRDLHYPLAIYNFGTWEPLADCKEATRVALEFLEQTESHDAYLKSEYFPDIERANLDEEERGALSRIENSVDNYLFER